MIQLEYTHVVVGAAGMPQPYLYMREAIEGFGRAVYGGWLNSDDLKRKARESLEAGKPFYFKEHNPDCSPRCASILPVEPGRDITEYINCHVEPGSRNDRLFKEITDAWKAREDKLFCPRVGDYFIRLDGKISRFTYDWGDGIQDGGGDGGFHCFTSGFMSYSGGLDDAKPKDKMVRVAGRTKLGSAWCWFHNVAGAHRAIYFQLPCNVYAEVE